jgi:HTH-type transcriptional regulator/antitoxin HigA
LAQIINKPSEFISEIVNGRKQITAVTALRLASAFGISAELWLGLEADYQLYLAHEQTPKAEMAEIVRRSRLYQLVPI